MPAYVENEITNKTCNVCNLNKTIDNFLTKKISKDGFRNYCKSCSSEKAKEHYLINKVKISERNKIWRENNKEIIRENGKNYHLNNPNYSKKYYQDNKLKIIERYKKRMESDEYFKLKENIRHLIRNSITYKGYRKNSKTIDILGINNIGFKNYIESKWSLPDNLDENGNIWMNWNNFGNPKDGILLPNKSWDLDHIIPLISVTTEEDIIKLNHYTNFQPLCSYINRIEKRGKINYIKIKNN